MILAHGEISREVVMDSILTSIKKLLGPSVDNTDFDADIIIHINTAFSILSQLGVGPTNGFSILDATKVWTDFLASSEKLEMAKTYVYLKVKLYFDPPLSSAAITSMNQMISELEWRINVAVDPPSVTG